MIRQEHHYTRKRGSVNAHGIVMGRRLRLQAAGISDEGSPRGEQQLRQTLLEAQNLPHTARPGTCYAVDSVFM